MLVPVDKPSCVHPFGIGVFDGIAVTFIGLSIVVVSGFFVMAVYTFIAHP